MAKILVVDDSATMRSMVDLSLSSVGHEVVQASDGVEGLKAATGVFFDLIITDVNMPNMDGIEFTRCLRALEDHRTTPIMVLTTEGSKEVMMEGRKAGANGWVVKPFTTATLLKLVDAAMARVAKAKRAS